MTDPNPEDTNDSHDEEETEQENGTENERDDDEYEFDIDGDVNWVRCSFRSPETLRDAAKREADHGQLSEEFRAVLQRIAYGEEVQHQEALRKELRKVRDEIDDIDAQLRDLRSKKEAAQRREARLEEQVQHTDSRKQKYEGQLESLESLLLDGTHIAPDNPIVKKAAGLMKISPEDVITDLRERNPAVPDHAFVPYQEADQEWNGIN